MQSVKIGGTNPYWSQNDQACNCQFANGSVFWSQQIRDNILLSLNRIEKFEKARENEINLTNLPKDIALTIIRMEKPEALDNLRLVSQLLIFSEVFNNSIQIFPTWKMLVAKVLGNVYELQAFADNRQMLGVRRIRHELIETKAGKYKNVAEIAIFWRRLDGILDLWPTIIYSATMFENWSAAFEITFGEPFWSSNDRYSTSVCWKPAFVPG